MPEPKPEPKVGQRSGPKFECRVFTEGFKRDAVRLAGERGNVSQVARDLGLHESVLTRWRKRLEAAMERHFPGLGNPQDPEMARLRCENARLQEENEILNTFFQKSCGYLHRPPAVRYRFIQEYPKRCTL